MEEAEFQSEKKNYSTCIFRVELLNGDVAQVANLGLLSVQAARPPDSSGNVDSTMVGSTFPIEYSGRAAYMETNP